MVSCNTSPAKVLLHLTHGPARAEGKLRSPLVLYHTQPAQQVDYRVVVTNTGKLAGSVSVLAFIKSDVSSQLRTVLLVLGLLYICSM